VLVRRGSHYFLPTLHRAQDSFRSKLCTTRCCAKSEILYVVLCIVFPQDVIRNRRKLLSREILFIVEKTLEQCAFLNKEFGLLKLIWSATKALFTGGSEIRVSEFWGYNILPQEGFDFFVTPHKKN
jgi:hypothetical protein